MHPGASTDLPVHTGTNGYDGQFYYRLALNPLTHQVTAFHITLDNPPYRQQRVGLPATAWAVREVFRAPTSVALVLVNVLALVVVGWAGATWARQYGRSTWWGVAVAASPALVMALARDLTEPLATAALIVGLLSWTRGRRWVASVAFTVAVLCRETVLVVLLGMGVWCLVQFAARWWSRRSAHERRADRCAVRASGCRGRLAAPRERGLGRQEAPDILGQRAGRVRLLEAGAVVLLQRAATSGCRTRESSTGSGWSSASCCSGC